MSHSRASHQRLAAPLAEPCPHCGGTEPELFHSSCRLRASWSASERAAFDRRDDAREALEMAWLAAPLPDRETGDLMGRRFGKRLVIGSGKVRGRPAWMVRCDCGQTSVVDGWRLLGGTSQCPDCARLELARGRARKYAGERLSEIARRTGLNIRTLRLRVQSGWPISRLTEPPNVRFLPRASPRRAA